MTKWMALKMKGHLMPTFSDDDVSRAVQLLWRDTSSPTELRILAKNGIHSGYFNDVAKLVAVAKQWSGKGNIYVTLNKVHPNCAARRLNRVEWTKSGETTKDSEIIRRVNIYVDFDPVRLSGIASTDAGHAAAKAVALKVAAFLVENGFPEPVVISSGNGYGLFVAIDLPTDDGKLVKLFLGALATKFDTDEVKVDTSVFNPSRIARLPGTKNTKGENTAERPHRLATIVSAPAGLTAVTAAQLQGIIDLIQSAKTAKSTEEVDRSADHFDMANWLTSRSVTYQVVPKTDGTQFTLNECPFKAEGHPAGGCAIFQRNDGTISASCFHSKCNWGWTELRKKLDPGFDVQAEQTILAGTETVKDPHRLARLVLADFAHPERATILRNQQSFYTWSDGIWAEKCLLEIKGIITKRVKAEFDRYAAAMARGGAQCQTPQVTTKLVGDVLNALSSMIQSELNDAACWLDGEGWPIGEILVCKSGVVHLTSFAAGDLQYSIPHTPRLFVQNKLDFDLDPNAPAPERWQKLLDEIWPDDVDSKALLQEFFGYCLTPNASMQKFLALIGASRGGKGTITGVLSHMVGRQNYCSIRLAKLGSRFGLENAVGQSLILVPDASMPRAERAAEVVELLKAITGGDAIDVDRKGLRIITTKLNGKIVVTSNNMIALPDASAALYARMLVLPFKKSFVGKEDTTLETTLRSEISGILLWAIDGYKRLRESRKFTVAGSGEILKRQLTMSGSPLATFVKENCVIDPAAVIEHAEFYTAYKGFCDFNGVEAVEKPEFSRTLQEVAPAVNADFRPAAKDRSGKRPRFYKGIGLKPIESNSSSESAQAIAILGGATCIASNPIVTFAGSASDTRRTDAEFAIAT